MGRGLVTGRSSASSWAPRDQATHTLSSKSHTLLEQEPQRLGLPPQGSLLCDQYQHVRNVSIYLSIVGPALRYPKGFLLSGYLRRAAENDAADLTQYPVEESAAMDQEDGIRCNITPVSLEARYGHVEIVKTLLRHDAIVDRELKAACAARITGIARLLYKHSSRGKVQKAFIAAAERANTAALTLFKEIGLLVEEETRATATVRAKEFGLKSTAEALWGVEDSPFLLSYKKALSSPCRLFSKQWN